MGRRVATRLKKLIEDAYEQNYTTSQNNFEVGDFVSLYAAETNSEDEIIEPGDFCIVIKVKDDGDVLLESISDSTIRITTNESNCYKPS